MFRVPYGISERMTRRGLVLQIASAGASPRPSDALRLATDATIGGADACAERLLRDVDGLAPPRARSAIPIARSDLLGGNIDAVEQVGNGNPEHQA
jgi:hypothetical protein